MTARLVQPTPPREPTTATTRDCTLEMPLAGVPSALMRFCLSRCNATSNSSSTTGWVRNSLAPLRRACKIDWPSPRALTARTGMFGNSALSWPISWIALFWSESRAITAMSGADCRATSMKNS